MIPARWASADPAALLEAALVRPSRKTADAAVAAFADVALGGATCDNALPAADFDAFPVELLERTVEELFAALLPVILVAILHPLETPNLASGLARYVDARPNPPLFSNPRLDG